MNETRLKRLRREVARAKRNLRVSPNQVAPKSKKTLAARSEQLERLIRRLEERERLISADEVAAAGAPPWTTRILHGRVEENDLGTGAVIDGDITCEWCRRREILERRRDKLSDLQERLIAEIVSARLRQSKATSRRTKITEADYERCSGQARSRKELALMLGVTDRGLRDWEERHRKNLGK